jgi:hypothetical protein
MAGNFLYLGTLTSTCAGQSVPFGDTTAGSSAVTATTIAMGTSLIAPVRDFFKDMEILITAGSGVGQRRRIRTSSSASVSVATVREWDAPRPDTASSFVVGVSIAGRDGTAVKGEASAAQATMTLRGDFYTQEIPPKRVITTSFSLGSPSTAQTVFVTSSASMHLETKVLDYLGPIYAIGKILCNAAPTSNVEVFVAPTWTLGRNRS